MVASSRKAQEIYAQLDQLNEHYRRVDVSLRRLRSDVNMSGIFVRDYLLDVAREHAPEYREQIAEFRRTNMASLTELKTLIDRDDQIQSLQSKLDDYWQAFEPVFVWNILQKVLNSSTFLREQVLPRREAVLGIAQDIEELNDANLETQLAAVMRRQEAFRRDLRRVLWQSVLVGAVVALAAVWRLRTAERRSEEQRNRERGDDISRRTPHDRVHVHQPVLHDGITERQRYKNERRYSQIL